MTKHAYSPTTLNSDKGSAFVSHVIKEVAVVLGITLKHPTTKHAQTIGLLEWSHASIRQALKIETGEPRSLRHQYPGTAVLNYSTSYHTSIWLWANHSFSWTHSLQYLGFKIGKSPRASNRSHFANCSRCFWPNAGDLPRCLPKCHANLHQIRKLFRQKGQRFKAQRSRLCICLTARSRSSRE